MIEADRLDDAADIVTSPLNRSATLRRDHRLALPLLASASSQLRVDADLAIVSSSGWAHGFPTDGYKVVYCHNPARWLYQSDEYLGGLARPESIRWVENQRSRWGSCTPGDRSIRLSARLQQMPAWVVDYVLVHELAHLLEVGHNDRFWAWVDRYPQAEKAKGYLMGWSSAARLDPPPGGEVD